MQIHRSGPLNWAQHMFWFYNDPFFMEDWGSEPRIWHRLRLPSQTLKASLEAALAASVERHEALRTYYERPGSAAPKQLVVAAHQPLITIGAPDEVQPVSIFQQPSFRCHVEVDGPSVLSALLVANLIDLDGASIAMIAREVENFLTPGEQSDRVATASKIQPIDLAKLELSSNHKADVRDRRAVQYFKEVWERAPRNPLPSLSWKYSSGNLRSAILRDYNLLEAAKSIASQCRVSVPTVFHAGICKVLGDWTRKSRFMFSTAVSNRWGMGGRDYVGRLAAGVDCHFEINSGDTHRAMLERTHKSLMNGYFFGNRDFGACAMEGVRVNGLAGSSLAKSILIEYHDYLEDVEGPLPKDGKRTHTGIESGRIDQIVFNIKPFSNFTNIDMKTDAAVFSDVEAIEMLQCLVDFIQQAAMEPDSPVSRPKNTTATLGNIAETRWLELEGSRFSANRIQANIELCPGVSSAAVFASGVDSVVAYIAGSEASLIDIHESLLVETSNDFLIRIPSLYLQVLEPPVSNKIEEGSWRLLPVFDRFRPDNDYSVRVAIDKRFETLKEVFIECNGDLEVDPTKSYAALGGKYLMISGMMELLRNRSYTGLSPADFLGLSSMSSLAKQMRRKVLRSLSSQ